MTKGLNVMTAKFQRSENLDLPIKEQIPKLMVVPYPISEFPSSTINLILPLALIPSRLC